jgi:hypothetical protein
VHENEAQWSIGFLQPARLLICAAAVCSIVSGAVLAFFRAEAPAKGSQRTLTFAERVAYQRAIEDVYRRHRICPKAVFKRAVSG